MTKIELALQKAASKKANPKDCKECPLFEIHETKGICKFNELAIDINIKCRLLIFKG